MKLSNVDVSLEMRVTGFIATATALLALALVAVGLNQIAALVAGFGFLAILERLRQLFTFFRSQQRHVACVVIACVALCALAAVCWTSYLGSPLYSRRSP
ncbi:MAG TPA: hypothetical protein VMR06_04105 [Dokdonella sp.]|uniref:hypothetical protein n=1 Tax=Dokdonella sp. TaxID=2291710 RepID=UPI002BDA5700|nr:hypothetical protein [Dokdonella sp.]HUD41161.1 hypothetical protein [Dokdonella sp.]